MTSPSRSTSRSHLPKKPVTPLYVVAVFPDGSVQWEQTPDPEAVIEGIPENVTENVTESITVTMHTTRQGVSRQTSQPDLDADAEETGVIQWFAAGLAIAAFGLGLGAIAPAFRAASQRPPSITACPNTPPLQLQRYSAEPGPSNERDL